MELDVFDLCFFLCQLFVFFVNLVAQMSILLHDELVFQLEILSSPQPYSGFVEILLDRVAIIFKSVDFAPIEIQVVFGGRVAVDSRCYLLFQLPLNVHD